MEQTTKGLNYEFVTGSPRDESPRDENPELHDPYSENPGMLPRGCCTESPELFSVQYVQCLSFENAAIMGFPTQIDRDNNTSTTVNTLPPYPVLPNYNIICA
jgi:hypothetical protein